MNLKRTLRPCWMLSPTMAAARCVLPTPVGPARYNHPDGWSANTFAASKASERERFWADVAPLAPLDVKLSNVIDSAKRISRPECLISGVPLPGFMCTNFEKYGSPNLVRRRSFNSSKRCPVVTIVGSRRL